MKSISSTRAAMNIPAFNAPNRVFPVMSKDPTPNTEQVTEPRRASTPVKNTTAEISVILMRHGVTDWNQEGRVQGGLDKSRLTNTGLTQARRAGIPLRNIRFETILCSPMGRARETFELLAESSGNPDLAEKAPDFLPELIEFQVPWQGSLRTELPHGTLKREYTEYIKNPLRFSYYGFNPIRDIMRRAQQVWETIAHGQANSYLVVSHNQMNKVLISEALQIAPKLTMWKQSNCCFNVFLLEDGKPTRLRLLNGTDILGNDPPPHRSPLLSGFLRLVFHLHGHMDGLRHETSGQTISHTCCIGNHQSMHFTASSTFANGEGSSRVTLPHHQVDEKTYITCFNVLDDIRRQHCDGYVVVSVENSTVHSTLIAACLGLGHEGITRFHSDPGGVTVIDVESSAEIGAGNVTVQCHNNYAYPNASGDFLLGYTNSAQYSEE